MQFYKIHTLGDGFLAAMPKPPSETLPAAISSISQQKVNQIICLLEVAETTSLGLKKEAELTQQYSMQFLQYPIEDLHLPASVASFSALSQQLYQDIKQGVNTVIHCRAGIGRTGMLCAAILANAGFSAPQAIDHISNHRGVKVPDTDEQVEWLRQHWVAFSITS
ncbi:MAG: protein-tyrosine phosphatase [Saprospiraceae bacterium]|jgi:protein-tyrosine phosphatase